MSNHFALIWNVKPGTEKQVEEIFANYESPDPVVRDQEGNVKGKLLGTQIFMRGNTIVRVMEVDGELRDIAPHLGRQPGIRELETKLDPLLEIPRDMSNPEGAREFFQNTMMRCLVARRADV
jgi:hypothetical protein